MLGKEMVYEISTCHMQFDANTKETDQKDPCFIYSGGNGPRKRRKYQVSLGRYHNFVIAFSTIFRSKITYFDDQYFINW